jgi:hypothetical protein
LEIWLRPFLMAMQGLILILNEGLHGRSFRPFPVLPVLENQL